MPWSTPCCLGPDAGWKSAFMLAEDQGRVAIGGGVSRLAPCMDSWMLLALVSARGERQ